MQQTSYPHLPSIPLPFPEAWCELKVKRWKASPEPGNKPAAAPPAPGLKQPEPEQAGCAKCWIAGFAIHDFPNRGQIPAAA